MSTQVLRLLALSRIAEESKSLSELSHTDVKLPERYSAMAPMHSQEGLQGFDGPMGARDGAEGADEWVVVGHGHGDDGSSASGDIGRSGRHLHGPGQPSSRAGHMHGAGAHAARRDSGHGDPA